MFFILHNLGFIDMKFKFFDFFFRFFIIYIFSLLKNFLSNQLVSYWPNFSSKLFLPKFSVNHDKESLLSPAISSTENYCSIFISFPELLVVSYESLFNPCRNVIYLSFSDTVLSFTLCT